MGHAFKIGQKVKDKKSGITMTVIDVSTMIKCEYLVIEKLGEPAQTKVKWFSNSQL